MGATIVVVDDEPKITQLLQVVLEQKGFDVVTAADGESAWELIREHRPALVVLDLLLPRLHGFQLCRRLKEDPDLAAVPVVAMSGVYKTHRYWREARQAGADAFLAKPITAEAALEVITKYLAPPVKAPATVLEEKLSELRRHYAETLPGKVHELESTWDELLSDTWETAGIRRLHLGVHGIAGTGATLGFRALAELAKQLELLLEHLMDRGTPPTAEERRRVRQLLGLMGGAYAAPVAVAPPAPLPEAVPVVTASPAEPAASAALGGGRIVLAEPESEIATDLARHLGHFGYEVTVVHDHEGLTKTLAEGAAVVIVDVDLAAPWLDEGAPHDPSGRPAWIFTAATADLTTRLQVVRAGGVAFFLHPVNAGAIVDVLDHLTAEEPPEPYRVLVVDDEPAAADHAALVLEDAGMLARTVTDPLQVAEVLDDLRPDLILMDLYMPGCSGLELARVLRQQEDYTGIPILFLSADRDAERQLAAIQHGADAFLVKPVDDQHLKVQVAARARRSREVRAAMVRDALTGLANHTRIQEQLDLDVQRARRDRRALAYAMLDIDLFKQVNDRYGHATGDRVIKTLARLLQQRLRRSDVVGRYGGEEFAIIFPDTTAAAAARVLDDVREAFAAITHRGDDTDFTVTFSAGVAEYPGCVDVASLKECADRALYEAKRTGRNRIVLAG